MFVTRPKTGSTAVATILAAVGLLAGPLAGNAVAGQHNDTKEICEVGQCDQQDADDEPLIDLLETVPAEESATESLRDVFLKAKKAFHQGRQEIQAIKKGEADPVECVPSFFGEGCDE